MKKRISFFILCFVLLGVLPVHAVTMRDTMIDTYSQSTNTFPDMTANHPNFPGVSFLVEEEALKGYPDGTFKPDGLINRAELTKMIVALFSPQEQGLNISVYQNCFPDVKDEWFSYYVCYAKEKGWVQGYPDGTFKPSNSVNRAEAMKIVFNAMIEESLWPTPTEAEKLIPLPKDSDENAWYAGYMLFAVAKELLDGQHVTGTEEEYYYKPGEPMTRKEVAELIWRTYLYMVERIEYVNLIAETACFQQAHIDLSDSEAKALWVTDLLIPAGYTEEDADKLSDIYSTDDVLEELKDDAIANQCGDASTIDMTKWDGFKIYAR
jgi:hypothetical protein